jgi:hypothetical protein
MNELRLERALRQGPPYTTHYVARPLPLDDGVLIPRLTAARRAALLLAVLILLLAVTVALILLAGGPRWSLVVEHYGTSPPTFVGVKSDGSLPEPVLEQREHAYGTMWSWSPDGRHLAYQHYSYLYIATGDGRSPVRVIAPLHDYHGVDSPSARALVELLVWSPDSSMLAVEWSTEGCIGSPHAPELGLSNKDVAGASGLTFVGGGSCEPPSGIDVFRTSGEVVRSISTPGFFGGYLVWSPDSRRIGFISCRSTECTPVSFREVAVEGDGDAVALGLANPAAVTWTPSNRLVVIEEPGPGVSFRAFSMAPDGSDKREIGVAVDGRLELVPLCSPDGRYFAYVTVSTSGSRVIHLVDLNNSNEVAIPFPDPDPVTLSWAPDGAQLAILTERTHDDQPAVDDLYLVDADGTDLAWTARIAAAEDQIAWRPGS